MKCPFCAHQIERVVDSRESNAGDFIRRRRECLKCNRRYTTYEYIEDVMPTVVKRDGRRESFNQQKLRTSILKACNKESSAILAVDDIISEIKMQLLKRGRKEVSSKELGEMIMDHLKNIDEAAYGRFRSVFEHFETPVKFVEMAREIRKEHAASAPAGRTVRK